VVAIGLTMHAASAANAATRPQRVDVRPRTVH
jgi:hypothetical protein